MTLHEPMHPALFAPVAEITPEDEIRRAIRCLRDALEGGEPEGRIAMLASARGHISFAMRDLGAKGDQRGPATDTA